MTRKVYISSSMASTLVSSQGAVEGLATTDYVRAQPGTSNDDDADWDLLTRGGALRALAGMGISHADPSRAVFGKEVTRTQGDSPLGNGGQHLGNHAETKLRLSLSEGKGIGGICVRARDQLHQLLGGITRRLRTKKTGVAAAVGATLLSTAAGLYALLPTNGGEAEKGKAEAVVTGGNDVKQESPESVLPTELKLGLYTAKTSDLARMATLGKHVVLADCCWEKSKGTGNSFVVVYTVVIFDPISKNYVANVGKKEGEKTTSGVYFHDGSGPDGTLYPYKQDPAKPRGYVRSDAFDNPKIQSFVGKVSLLPFDTVKRDVTHLEVETTPSLRARGVNPNSNEVKGLIVSQLWNLRRKAEEGAKGRAGEEPPKSKKDQLRGK